MTDREKILAKHYDLQQGVLPADVLSKSRKIMKAASGTGIATPSSSGLEAAEAPSIEGANNLVIEQVFMDERINLRQKESIAKSILAGEYSMGIPTNRGAPNTRIAAAHDLDLARGVGLLRRHVMAKPRFMEVVSTQAPIIVVNVNDVLLQEQAKRRSNARKTGYFLFNQYLPEEERPIYKERVGSQDVGMHYRAEMVQLAKQNAVKKCKEGLTLCKVLAESERRRDKDFKERRREIRKKIEDFRHKVLERLTEQAHPLKGRIMRSLTDKMALALMEHYRGFIMSVDAIISLIGTSLGKESSNNNGHSQQHQQYPDDNHNTTSSRNDIKHVLEATNAAWGSCLSQPKESVSRSMEMAMEIMPYSNEYPLNGRSFGSRAASRPRPSTPIPAISVPEDSLLPPKSPSWNAPSPTLRRLGSGFTVSLVPVVPVALAMRGVAAAAATEDASPLMTDSIMSMQDERDQQALRVIDALIEEMKFGGTLPSLQPEKIMSDRQLERLGTNEATFDSIAREVKFQKSKKAREQAASMIAPWQSRLDEKEGRESETLDLDIEMGYMPRPASGLAFVTEARATPQNQIERITDPGELKIPRSLKTRTMLQPESPYKTWDHGVAAGSGLQLWSGPRAPGKQQQWEGSKVKIPTGFTKSTTRSAKSTGQRQMMA